MVVMKTIQMLTIGMVALFSAGALDAAPWSRHNPQPTPSRHHHNSHGHGHGYGNSFHNRIEVKAQTKLRQLGYYRGRIDGQFGSASRAALVRFQRDSRIPRTARLDPRTIRALRIR